MKRFPGAGSSLGLLGILLLLIIVDAAGEASHPQSIEYARLVSTAWHFGSDRLIVPMSLPVGTVIAAAVLPSGHLLFTRDRNIYGGLWGVSGPIPPWVAIKTALDGVMVRIVPDGSWGRVWHQGDLRIELVKTGVIRAGVLNGQLGAEYRLWRNNPSGPQVLLREQLVMDKPLTVVVSAASPTDQPVVSGRRKG